MCMFTSCKKQELDYTETPPDQQENLIVLKDSASYTIDGKVYTCDNFDSFGKGNVKANLDSVTGYWATDTIMYYSEFSLDKHRDEDRSDDGYIRAIFIKKYEKSQLVSSPSIPAILHPKNIVDHYAIGPYHYAQDFEKYNRQNGVNLILRKVKGSEIEMLYTQLPNRIIADSNHNVSFEITRFDAIGDGSYLLEAKFDAIMFDVNGTSSRVENGYIRYRVH